MLIYKEIEKLNSADISRMLMSKDKNDVVNGLLSLAIFGDDWKFSQDTCVAFFDHSDIDIVKAAIIGIGHIARVHRKIGQSAISALNSKIDIAEISGTIEDVLNDIGVYVRGKPIADGPVN